MSVTKQNMFSVDVHLYCISTLTTINTYTYTHMNSLQEHYSTKGSNPNGESVCPDCQPHKIFSEYYFITTILVDTCCWNQVLD